MSPTAEKLQKLSNNRLIDVVKNYRQYGYDDSLRAEAIAILEERGIDKTQLQLTGNFENHGYNKAESYYTSFSKNSMIAMGLYVAFVFFSLFVPEFGIMIAFFNILYMFLYFGLLLAYLTFLTKSFLDQSNFYKLIGKEHGAEGALTYMFLGLPLWDNVLLFQETDEGAHAIHKMKQIV